MFCCAAKGGAESAMEPVAAANPAMDVANLQNRAKLLANVTTAISLPKVKVCLALLFILLFCNDTVMI